MTQTELTPQTLMNFNPYTAVERKLNMKVSKKGNTYLFTFSNGFTKQKTLPNETAKKMYYTFFEDVYNQEPANFPESLENILKNETQRISITFHETKTEGIRCKVEVRHYEKGELVKSAAKRGDNLLKCYQTAKEELHKKLSLKEETLMESKNDEVLTYLIEENKKKDTKIEKISEEFIELQMITEINIQKSILKYTQCPVCKGEYIIKESSEGKLFVGCVNYNDNPEAHKHSGFPYDTFAKLLHKLGLLKTYDEWWNGL